MITFPQFLFRLSSTIAVVICTALVVAVMSA